MQRPSHVYSRTIRLKTFDSDWSRTFVFNTRFYTHSNPLDLLKKSSSDLILYMNLKENDAGGPTPGGQISNVCRTICCAQV